MKTRNLVPSRVVGLTWRFGGSHHQSKALPASLRLDYKTRFGCTQDQAFSRRSWRLPHFPGVVLGAIQEQLGLKLEPAKGPVETLVIERAVEEPSGNWFKLVAKVRAISAWNERTEARSHECERCTQGVRAPRCPWFIHDALGLFTMQLVYSRCNWFISDTRENRRSKSPNRPRSTGRLCRTW
jgi:hypothetical protein